MFRSTCWNAVSLACLLALPAGCRPVAPTAAAQAKKPLEVDVRLPETRTLVEHEEFAGRLVAAEGIEIKARVSGELEKVLFKDGDDVAAGQPLFEIDARPYQAEFDRTVALVAQLESRVQKLSRQESRAKNLLSRQSISQEDYETAAFDLAEAQSGLAAARAAHDLAELTSASPRSPAGSPGGSAGIWSTPATLFRPTIPPSRGWSRLTPSTPILMSMSGPYCGCNG